MTKKAIILAGEQRRSQKKKEKNSGFDVIRPAPPEYNIYASNLIPK